ncbi:hypothetical protein [Frateuria soli]|uniref:hypothetical protein n=1 Tax=Frateuria soli TaxID=1542730 RepID=UPI001E419015|nr:hypothetical protein [Frateuria soli]UGB38504.1 hypothetical protein LQ771_01185 [Frateuria soli]
MRLFQLPSPRSRHPLARALSLVVGVAVVGVMLVFGLVVAGVLLVGGGLWLALRQWNRARAVGRSAPAAATRQQVLEGDFVVLHEGRPAAR